MNGLIEGRIVHFVLNTEEHRPAIVVRDWSHTNVPGSEDGMVNLVVVLDGSNDGMIALARVSGTDSALLAWKTFVHYSENKEPGTWHRIEDV